MFLSQSSFSPACLNQWCHAAKLVVFGHRGVEDGGVVAVDSVRLSDDTGAYTDILFSLHSDMRMRVWSLSMERHPCLHVFQLDLAEEAHSLLRPLHLRSFYCCNKNTVDLMLILAGTEVKRACQDIDIFVCEMPKGQHKSETEREWFDTVCV